MKHLLLVGCALLTACVGLSCLSEQERFEQARVRAQEAAANGDLEGLREALGEARDHRPEAAEGVVELSSLLVRAGEAPQALWLLEEGLERFPERVELRLQLARVALVVGNPALARQVLEALAAGDTETPEHLEALMLLARAELDLGALERALELLARAEVRHPESPAARRAHIATLLREGRTAEAHRRIEEVQQIAESPEERRQLEIWVAAIEAGRGQLEVALERLRALVSAEPRDVAALEALVRLLLGADRAQEALEQLELASQVAPDEAGHQALLAQIHLQLGRLEESETALRRFVELAPSPSAYVLLARFYGELSDTERASRTFAEGAARFPVTSMLQMYRVESLIELGREHEARRELEVFREMAPSDPHVAYLQARLLLLSGRAQAAAARLAKLVSRLDRSYTQYWLGRALEEGGELEAAERRYGLTLAREPGHRAAASALLRIAGGRGDWRAVAQSAHRLVTSAPRQPEAYATLVTALARTGEWVACEDVARLFARRFPERPEARALLVFALRAAGRGDQAASELERAVARFGDHPDLAIERAHLLAERGRVDEGIALLRRAIAERAESGRHHASLAALLLAKGEGAAASREVERALALEASDPAPLELRARYLASTGQTAAALADCDRYLELRPNDARVLFMKGVLHAERGEGERAVRAYRRAAELDERAFAARNNLALLLAARGDLEAALISAQEAYALAADDPEVIDTLAGLYLRTGLAGRAVALLERARVLAPEAASIASHLAQARRQLATATVRDAARPSPPAARVQPRGDSDVAARLRELVRPNIVLVLVDTLRADWLTPYGDDRGASPELARWAERGVLFERVYAQSSWTKASMASLMTSLWPRSHAVRATRDGLASGALTLAEVFQEAGYRCYGVQSNGWLEQTFGFHQGFDRYLFPRGGGGLWLRTLVWPHADNVYLEAERLLESRDPSRPFFLYLHFMDVHEYAAPADHKRFGGGDEGAYVAAIRWLDEVIERLRHKLDRERLLDRTILVLASDHGEAFGENGVHGHARNVLSSELRVPLIFRFPFRMTPIRVRDRVRNLDLAPTLLELAGIPVPPSFEGESLLPLLTGSSGVADRPSYASLTALLYKDAGLQDSVVDGHWTFARSPGQGGAELLFDRSVDPGENVNLVDFAPDAARRMRALLDAHLEAQSQPDTVRSDIRIDPVLAAKLRALGYGR